MMYHNEQKRWDRRAILKSAQRALSEVMPEKKKLLLVKSKSKLSCPIKSAESSIRTQRIGCKDCILFYENGIDFKTNESSSFALMIEEYVLSLKSFLRPRVSETGPLTDTSRRRSATSWALKQLRNLFMFARTAKWRQLSAMPTSSRCLHGI